jgi:hypothetical protein
MNARAPWESSDRPDLDRLVWLQPPTIPIRSPNPAFRWGQPFNWPAKKTGCVVKARVRGLVETERVLLLFVLDLEKVRSGSNEHPRNQGAAVKEGGGERKKKKAALSLCVSFELQSLCSLMS